MSRFGATGTFYYDASGTLGASGTTIVLLQSQMPNYPFEEYRITDKVEYRNLNGDAYSYKNYTKTGYIFKWNYMDEAMTGTLRSMFNANPALSFTSNGTLFGTFLIKGDPSIVETQLELYDIEMTVEEK